MSGANWLVLPVRAARQLPCAMRGAASDFSVLPVISWRHLHADLPEHTPASRASTCLARYLCHVIDLPPVVLSSMSHLNAYQHVRFATRGNSLLDLVMTSEPELIDEVMDFGCFSNSDHMTLGWNINFDYTGHM